MDLIDTVLHKLIGLYSLDTPEQEAVKSMLDVDDGINSNPDMQTAFAEAANVLFPGISLQKANNYTDVKHRKDGETFVSRTSYAQFANIMGSGGRCVDACVNLPKELVSEVSAKHYFNGRYNAGTLIVMNGPGNLVYATLDISRFYGDCGQHEMDIITRPYNRNVVDDIVDKLGAQLGVESPRLNQNLRGSFIPGFAKWDEIVQAYEKAHALLEADRWSRSDWDSLRNDAFRAANPAIRELSTERYQARLKELVAF